MKGEEERLSELRSCVKSGDGRPGLLVPYKPYGFCGRKSTMKEEEERISELRSCVEVEVAVLGSPSLAVVMVFVDVKQH